MHPDRRPRLLPEQGRTPGRVRRTAELARYTELLGNPTAVPWVVEIVGDPWTGKTQLLNDFIGVAADRGWPIAAGYAGHLIRQAPRAAIAEVLNSTGCRSCGRPAGERPRQPLCPAMFATFPGSSTYCRILEMVNTTGRLLLVLDDTHWADDASIRALEQFVGHGRIGRLLVLLAYRPRQAGSALARMLDRVRVDGHVLRLAPDPLTDQQALALLPDNLSRRVRESLLRQANGNPGLLRLLAAMALPVNRAASPPWAGRADALAECLRDFDALSELGLLAVRSAAALQDAFEPEMLEQVARLSKADVLLAVDELIRHDLVWWEPGRRALTFRNAAVRMLANQLIGPEWRLDVQVHVAEATGRATDPVPSVVPAPWQPTLEHTASAQPSPWPGTTTESDNGVDMEDHALTFGKRLAGRGRITESLAIMGDLAERAGRRPVLRAKVAWWRAWLWRLLGEYRKARLELRSALDNLPGSVPTSRNRLWRARLAVALEAGHASTDELADAAARVRQAWDPAQDPLERVHGLALLATVDARLGDIEQAEYRMYRATPWLGELSDGNPAERVDVLGCLGAVAAEVGRHQVAVRCWEQGLRIAEWDAVGMVPWFAVRRGRLELEAGEITVATWYASLGRRTASTSRNDFLLGAVAELEKSIARAMLGRIGQRSAGGPATEASGADDPGDDGPDPDMDPWLGLEALSRRERDIALLVSDGHTNQQIARSLGLSHKTVETYLARIFKKLAVSSRSQVAAAVGRARI